MISKVLKAKKGEKANSKMESNGIIKTAAQENSKKKKQQLEKVKAVKKDLVGIVDKKSKAKKEVLEPAADSVEHDMIQNDEGDNGTLENDVGPERTIVIFNLTKKTADRMQLEKLLAPYGKVLFIYFSNFRNFTKTKISAHVVLDSVEAAAKALKLTGTILDDATISVRKPIDVAEIHVNENTVVVKYEKSSVTLEDLTQTFSSCGDIISIKTLMSNKMECKGIGKVEFKSPDAVNLALEIKCTLNDEKPIFVKRYSDEIEPKKPESKTKKPRIESNAENTIFVKNLKLSENNKSVHKIFSKFGKIQYVSILKNFKEHVKLGKAFVCFESAEAASLALKLNDTMIDGQQIYVEPYANKPKRPHKRFSPKPSSDKIKKAPKKLNKKNPATEK